MNRRTVCVLTGAAVLLLFAEGLAAAEAPSPPPVARTPSHLLGIKQVLGALVIGFSGLGVAGLILAAAALCPDRVARAEQALQQGRWRGVLVGVLTTAALILAAALVGKAGEAGAPALGVVALLLLGFLGWLAVFGLAATASLVGRGLLAEEIATGHAPWRRMVPGALVVGAALLVPIFGWVFFLYLACRGVGGATLALFAPSAPGAEAEKTEETEL
jgi:Na+-driven multidrug efflux pump